MTGCSAAVRIAAFPFLLAVNSIHTASAESTQVGTVHSVCELIETYNLLDGGQTNLPELDSREQSRLWSGKVVSYREAIEGPGNSSIYRIVAYAIVPEPRIRVWVATLGGGEKHEKELVEIPLSTDQHGGAVWYQYLSLPWPVADRHWVLRTLKRVELARFSTNRIWEHSWNLEPRGPTKATDLIESGQVQGVKPDAIRHAIYLPANSGGWMMGQIDSDNTLVAVHATAELGGHLPDRWVARYVRRKLSSVLGQLADRAIRAEQALDGPIPLYTGTGLKISAEMLSE